MMDPDTLLDLLKHLVSPDSSKMGKQNQAKLSDILLSNLKTLHDKLQMNHKLKDIHEELCNHHKDGDDTESSWSFVMHCVQLMKLLKDSIEKSMELYHKRLLENPPSEKSAPPLSPDTLSFGQQKTLTTALQFVTCFGLCPSLLPGVGIPLSLRSGYGKLLEQDNNTPISPEEKNVRLLKCLEILITCSKHTSFSGLILAKHFGDLLAGLLQIIHGPKLTTNTTDSNTVSERKVEHGISKLNLQHASPASLVDAVRCDTSGRMENVTVISAWDSSRCKEEFDELLKKVHPSVIVRELIVLQGGPPPKQVSGSKQLVRAPVWLRKACGQLLSQQLCYPRGVINVLSGILAGPGGSQTERADDWRKCDMVAKIVTNCPSHMSPDEYYSLIGPQITDIIINQDKAVGGRFLRVACSTITGLLKQNKSMAEKYFLNPLLKPLLDCLDNKEVPIHKVGQQWVSEDQINTCITNIHKVYICGSNPNSELILSLTPVILTLFYLYCFTKKGVSHIRLSCKQLLVHYLKSIDKAMSLITLEGMALPNVPSDLRHMHPRLQFTAGPIGGVMVVTKEFDGLSDIQSSELYVDSLVDILCDLQKDGLAGDFFLFILKELTDILSEKDKKLAPTQQRTGTATLLDIEDRQQQELATVQHRIVIISLLGAITEKLGYECLKHATQVLEFVKATLERGVYIIKETDDEMLGLFENETLSMAMGLLTATMGGAFKLTNEDREQMKELLPMLEELANHHPSEEIQEMASDLRIAIATHGAVWSEMLKMAASKNKEKSSQKQEAPKNKSLIEELVRNVSEPAKMATPDRVEGEQRKRKVLIEELPDEENELENCDVVDDKVDSKKTWEESDGYLPHELPGKKDNLMMAFSELCDPLIPVRGHALITLTKLVHTGDKETLDKWETVLKVFQENLGHEDTYLYLQSVLGLSEIADRRPEDVVPLLVKEFRTTHDGNAKYQRTVDLRLKLGEVLVKSSRALGDIIPKYRDQLLSAFLIGAKDKENLIRASSLSNIGEVCQLLRYSLGPIIHEVLECCSGSVRSDRSVEVRRAAAVVLTLIIRGVGEDVLKILSGVIKDIYRLLKLVAVSEKDETVLIHVNIALQELDTIMRDYLFPKQTLTKRIRVLDPE